MENLNELLRVALSLSLSGSLLALALLAVKPLLKGRVTQRWQYYIWLVAAIRMLVPLTPPVSLMGALFERTPPALSVTQTMTQTTGEAPAFSSPGSENIPSAALDSPRTEHSGGPLDSLPPMQPTRTLDGGTPLRELLAGAGVCWLFVAALLFTRKVTSYGGFVRFIRVGCRTVENRQVLEAYASSCQALHVRRPPLLCTNKLADSPMLVGFVRPRIVLPEGQLQAQEALPFIFRHELTHYRRMDYLYKWLLQLMLCIHFFNPVAYLVSREAVKACELSCDEAVARALDSAGRKAYGSALIGAVEYGGGYGGAIVSMTLCENAKILKERLDAIKMIKEKKKHGKALAALLTAALCCGAVLTGAHVYAAPQAVSPDAPTVQKTQIPPQGEKEESAAPYLPQPAAAAKASAGTPAGYQLLREESFSLEGIQMVSLDMASEMVTIHPVQGNTLSFSDYGKSTMTYAEDERVQYRVEGSRLIIEAGEWNEKWGYLDANDWQQRVDIYLPESYRGALSAGIISGSLDCTMALQVRDAMFTAGSGSMTLLDIAAQESCALSVISGSMDAGALRGNDIRLDAASGDISAGSVTSRNEAAISVISGGVKSGDVSGVNCTLTSGSGGLTAGNITASGKVGIDGISGHINLGRVDSGTFTIDNGSGKIAMDALSGRGEASTLSGSVAMGVLSLEGSVSMEAGSGSIHAALPQGSGVRFFGEGGGSGSYDTFFTTHEEGSGWRPNVSGATGSAPYQEIKAQVISGSVVLTQAE